MGRKHGSKLRADGHLGPPEGEELDEGAAEQGEWAATTTVWQGRSLQWLHRMPILCLGEQVYPENMARQHLDTNSFNETTGIIRVWVQDTLHILITNGGLLDSPRT